MRRSVLAGLLVLAAGCKKGSTPTEPECRITGVTVSQAQFTMTVGQTVDVQAAIAQTGCTGLPAVTFSSGDQAIVTVTPSGTVTAVGAGVTTITAQIQGRNDKATAQVTVVGRVLSITLTPDSSAIPVTGTVQLAATLSTDPGTATGLEWTSADPGKATVNGTGLVTGVAAGTVTITVKAVADQTKSATAKVTVVPRVSAVVVDPVRDTILVTETVPLSATVTGDPGVSVGVTWSSSDLTKATVSTAGVVTGVAAGSAEITARSVADPTKSAISAITVLPRVTAVTVTPPTSSIGVGATVSLTATVSGDPGVASTVTWNSLQPAIATVSTTGVVTGVAAGTATIVATSTADPTKSGSAQVNVTVPVVGTPTGDLCFQILDNGGGGNSPPAEASALLATPACPVEVRLDLRFDGFFLPVQGYLASSGAAPLMNLVNSNPGLAVATQEDPAAWSVAGAGIGNATFDVSLASAPATKARILVRVVSAPETVCMSLTPTGPCATSVSVKVGQSVTVYSRNASGQPAAAAWSAVGLLATLPQAGFFDTKVTITGVSVGTMALFYYWTGALVPSPALATITVIP